MAAVRRHERGELSRAALEAEYDRAIRDTIRRFEETGSPVVTDGEQSKPSFFTYPLAGVENVEPGGREIRFADGHVRQLPRLTRGPFRYGVYADTYLKKAKTLTRLPIKQAVISASAISLIYPDTSVPDYAKQRFLDDLANEAERDIRRCLAAGAHVVQVDFTEGRLSVKLDPSHALLESMIELNNRVLARFSDEDRARIGVHTCPGGDRDSTHSLDVDYAELLPSLFRLRAGRFYIQMASERDRERVLAVIRDHAKPEQMLFIGVIDPINPELETPERVRDRVLEAARFISAERLGTTDDCGFSPFGDDTSTARDKAFDKIRARVLGTRMAERELGI